MPPNIDTALSTLVAFLPSLVAAVLLLIVGYIVARVVSALVKRLLRRTGLDNRLARSLGGTGLASEGAVGSVVFWLIMDWVQRVKARAQTGRGGQTPRRTPGIPVGTAPTRWTARPCRTRPDPRGGRPRGPNGRRSPDTAGRCCLTAGG